MPTLNARGLRLREALDEFIRGFTGDTGTRRAGLRSQLTEGDRALIETSQSLLGLLDGSNGSTTAEGRDTPGAKARDRAATGPRTMDSASQHARTLLGAAASNGSAGAPAGGGTNEGGQT